MEFLKQCLIVEFQATGVGDPDHSRFFAGQSLLTAPAQAYSPAGQRGKTLNAASLPGNGGLFPAGVIAASAYESLSPVERILRRHRNRCDSR